jgi:hypothetical protein
MRRVFGNVDYVCVDDLALAHFDGKGGVGPWWCFRASPVFSATIAAISNLLRLRINSL